MDDRQADGVAVAEALAESMKAAGFAAGDCAGAQEELARFADFLKRTRAQADRSEALQRQLLCARRGIPQGQEGRYLRLADAFVGEGMAFEAALEAAVEEYPIRGAENPVAVASTGETPAQKGWREMSLAERTELYRRSPERARALAGG